MTANVLVDRHKNGQHRAMDFMEHLRFEYAGWR
jgi:hypothetical protein